MGLQTPITDDRDRLVTLLHWAIQNEQFATFKKILEVGGIDPRSKDGLDALNCALHCSSRSRLSMVGELIRAGVFVDALDGQGLYVAAFQKDVQLIDLLVDLGANVVKTGGRALSAASYCRHTSVVIKLLRLGAQPRFLNEHDQWVNWTGQPFPRGAESWTPEEAVEHLAAALVAKEITQTS